MVGENGTILEYSQALLMLDTGVERAVKSWRQLLFLTATLAIRCSVSSSGRRPTVGPGEGLAVWIQLQVTGHPSVLSCIFPREGFSG